MSEVSEFIELVNRLTDLAESASNERHRAEGLAARNHRLTKEIDEFLKIEDSDDEVKREIQKRYGPGLEGRIKFLMEVAGAGPLPDVFQCRVKS